MSHLKQTDEGVVRSLVRAGIRRRYHELSLTQVQHPRAQQLYEWVTTTSKGDPGRGFTFIGGNEIEDLAIVTARGLHLTGRTVRVFNLLSFCDRMRDDREWTQTLIDEATTLLLLQCGPRRNEAPVFTPRELRFLENYLTDWSADGNRLMLHFNQRPSAGWFTGEFLQRVAESNDEIEGTA